MVSSKREKELTEAFLAAFGTWGEDFDSFLLDRSDILLQFEKGESMPIPRALLENISGYFKDFYAHGLRGSLHNKHDLQQFSLDQFSDALLYGYLMPKSIIEFKNFEDLLEIATFFQMDKLFKKCEIWVNQHKKDFNPTDLQELSKMYGLHIS